MDRGKDSWGWTNGKEVSKHLGPLRQTLAEAHLNAPTALIHTRFATWGEKTAENSHPFTIGSIIGVHNGQLSNHKELGAKYHRDYNVDSEHLFYHLNDGLPLNDIEGYGAIAFFQNDVIHLGKFNKGEMALAKTSFGWAWASTKATVVDSLGMAGLLDGISFMEMKDGELYRLEGDEVFLDERPLDVSERKYAPVVYGGHKTKNYSPGPQWGYIPGTYAKWNKATQTLDRFWNGSDVPYVEPKIAQMALVQPVSALTDEPGSDDDDAIDVSPDSEWQTPVEKYRAMMQEFDDEVAVWCDECGEEVVQAEFAVQGSKTICSSCLHRVNVVKSSKNDTIYYEDDLSEERYNFWQYRAEELMTDGLSIKCDDCLVELFPDDEVFVAYAEDIKVCEVCYACNYETQESEPSNEIEWEGQELIPA